VHASTGDRISFPNRFGIFPSSWNARSISGCDQPICALPRMDSLNANGPVGSHKSHCIPIPRAPQGCTVEPLIDKHSRAHEAILIVGNRRCSIKNQLVRWFIGQIHCPAHGTRALADKGLQQPMLFVLIAHSRKHNSGAESAANPQAIRASISNPGDPSILSSERSIAEHPQKNTARLLRHRTLPAGFTPMGCTPGMHGAPHI